MNQQVFNGNNIDLLKNYPDNYFDSVVTDPPYGLGKEPNASELMKDWIEYGYHEIQGKGFMGKEWDAFIPQPIFWKEIYRVLKPGGHILAFYGTRTYDWGVMAMRFAGFEVRDCIQWLYGSGFPKSHNISKALDKIGNNSQEWDGWGTALKPANEPIVLARKPLEKGLSIAENILKWGVGGINIDASRIGTTENLNGGAYSENKKSDGKWGSMHEFVGKEYEQPQGRFPANIILDEVAAEILDEQSGVTKSQRSERGNIIDNNVYGKYKEQEDTTRGHNDKGGASRFFYVAKASKSERNKGLDDMPLGDAPASARSKPAEGRKNPLGEKRANFHPTVKPIKLMQYLVKMITPPNGIVLDPFCGSGTTGVACKIDGFNFVGLEQDAEYTKIAKARINNYIIEPKQTEMF